MSERTDGSAHPIAVSDLERKVVSLSQLRMTSAVDFFFISSLSGWQKSKKLGNTFCWQGFQAVSITADGNADNITLVLGSLAIANKITYAFPCNLAIPVLGIHAVPRLTIRKDIHIRLSIAALFINAKSLETTSIPTHRKLGEEMTTHTHHGMLCNR